VFCVCALTNTHNTSEGKPDGFPANDLFLFLAVYEVIVLFFYARLFKIITLCLCVCICVCVFVCVCVCVCVCVYTKMRYSNYSVPL
jgi:hypothetical protein